MTFQWSTVCCYRIGTPNFTSFAPVDVNDLKSETETETRLTSITVALLVVVGLITVDAHRLLLWKNLITSFPFCKSSFADTSINRTTFVHRTRSQPTVFKLSNLIDGSESSC